MPKRIGCESLHYAALDQQREIRLHRNSAERQYCARAQQRQLRLQVGTAILQLGRQRFIRRRRATQSRADISTVQQEPIAALDRSWLAGESRALEGAIKKVS